MSRTADQNIHYRVGTSLGLVAALMLVACAPEADTASFEETEPTAAAGDEGTVSGQDPQNGKETVPENEDEDQDDDDVTEDPEEPDGLARDLSEPVVVQQTVWDFANEQDVEIEVTIDPFMRDAFEGEDYISGRVTYEVIGEDGEFALNQYGTAPAEVRLFDPSDPDFLYYPNGVTTETLGEMAADVQASAVSAVI